MTAEYSFPRVAGGGQRAGGLIAARVAFPLKGRRGGYLICDFYGVLSVLRVPESLQASNDAGYRQGTPHDKQ